MLYRKWLCTILSWRLNRHPLKSLKSLLPVEFTLREGPSRRGLNMSPSTGEKAATSASLSKEDQKPMCPSCKKQLSNNILLFGQNVSKRQDSD